MGIYSGNRLPMGKKAQLSVYSSTKRTVESCQRFLETSHTALVSKTLNMSPITTLLRRASAVKLLSKPFVLLERPQGLIGVAAFSSREVLGDSLSDAYYDITSPSKGGAPTSLGNSDRPRSNDVRLSRARSAEGRLHDSLSEGNYESHRRSSRPSTVALSSIADPDTFWTGSSLSDGYYEMPASLRGAPRSVKRKQSHHSAGPRSLPLMQRVVAQRHVRGDQERLHDSYSHSGY